MGRKVLLFVVLGLLLSGLIGSALADLPPRRGWGVDPGPKPWVWGDPDWPSYSKGTGAADQPAVEDGLTIVLSGWDVCMVRTGPACQVRDEHRASSRRYAVRILGLTIVIRR